MNHPRTGTRSWLPGAADLSDRACLARLGGTVPPDQAFRPLAETHCPLVQGGK